MWDHAATQGPSPAVTGTSHPQTVGMWDHAATQGGMWDHAATQEIASDVPGPSHQELGGAAAAQGMSSAVPGHIEQPVVMANAAVDQALQELNLPPEQELTDRICLDATDV
ncbi:hypothetical protein WJX77_008152 [Trebouxia sp. C0004]